MRNKMKREVKIKSTLALLSYLMISVYLAGVAFATPDMKKETPGETKKIIAKVNGSPIYEDQIKPEMEKSLKKFKKYGNINKASPELTQRHQKRALGKVIDNELVHQESLKMPIEDLDDKVEQKVQDLKNKYGSQELYERILKQRRHTEESLRESLRTKVIIDEYLKKQGILEPEVPEELIRKAYEANPKSYTREEMVKVSHILLQVDENAKPEDKEKARKKADQIRKEIIEGKDFTEMAKEHSDCNSAPGGGNLDYIKKGYMPEEFDKVAFALEKDTVSEIVETKFGYHIIQVTDQVPGGKIPYEEVQDFIRKYLQEGESKKKLAAHLAELRKKATIEILLD
jgi:peptidyl-prolyl cis-trans isomerase C